MKNLMVNVNMDYLRRVGMEIMGLAFAVIFLVCFVNLSIEAHRQQNVYPQQMRNDIRAWMYTIGDSFTVDSQQAWEKLADEDPSVILRSCAIPVSN